MSANGAAWVELAQTELSRAGHRASGPRAAVLELIGRQDCVLSAQEIAERLRSRRQVGIATIYRTLELLERLRLVQRLDTGGGASARYEPVLPDGGHHHHHLVCDDCGRVTPFTDQRLERAIEAVTRSSDYKVGGHDVVLRGTCPSCS